MHKWVCAQKGVMEFFRTAGKVEVLLKMVKKGIQTVVVVLVVVVVVVVVIVLSSLWG